MQAGFGLEPLSGEAGGDGGAGGCADAAEGEVACGPDFGACGVGAEDGAADVIRPYKRRHAALDDRQRCTIEPDVFSDQRACGFVIFGDAVSGAVEHRVDGDAARQRSDRLPPGEIVFVAGFQHPADGELRHPASGVVGVAVATRRPVVVGDVARRVIGERPAAARPKADGAEFVGGGGVGINIGLHPRAGVDGVADPVADGIIGIDRGAIGAIGRSQTFARGVAVGFRVQRGLHIADRGQIIAAFIAIVELPLGDAAPLVQHRGEARRPLRRAGALGRRLAAW